MKAWFWSSYRQVVLFAVLFVLSSCAVVNSGCWSGLNSLYCQDSENLDEERRWNIPPAPTSGLNATCVKSGGVPSMTAMPLIVRVPALKILLS